MSENKNPLNDFLEVVESNRQPSFDDLPFDDVTTENPNPHEEQAEAKGEPQQTMFEQALVQTPVASNPSEKEDPFTAALKKAQAQSNQRLTEIIAAKDAVFCYGKAKDPITDHDCTFEELRQKYEGDFPELSESKKVSWSVSYGKVTKTVTNPGSDKVYDIKAEIEKSKAFIDGIKKAKNDADKAPECLVKPHVTANSKGQQVLPSYKGFCISMEEAKKSNKAIVLLPSKDGRLYQIRKTPIGDFTAPVQTIPELEKVKTGLEWTLPKIPAPLLLFVLNFFKEISSQYEVEALVHVLYNTANQQYILFVPKQTLTKCGVEAVMEEEYPDHLIHVMDIHSHNTMAAKFSFVDDQDECATRLYAVVGRLDKLFPDISVRAGCAGTFIPLNAEDIFEMDFKEYPYPVEWKDKLDIRKDSGTDFLNRCREEIDDEVCGG